MAISDGMPDIVVCAGSREDSAQRAGWAWLLELCKSFAAHAGIGLFALLMVAPIIWMIFASLKPPMEVLNNSSLLGSRMTLENYVNGWHAFPGQTFGAFFLNSFVLCGLSIVGNLLSCSLAAYAFARLDFPYRRTLFAALMLTIMLPIHVQLIPQYIVFLQLGWVNTILPLVVPKFLAVDAFYIFLMVQFMRTIPRDLEDAATIDGANLWQRFFHVILPLSLPALATTAVFTFISVYSDYFSQLIYLSAPERLTVPLALRLFVDTGGGSSFFGGLFAMSLLSLGPLMGVYFASQRLLVQGIATTGLK